MIRLRDEQLQAQQLRVIDLAVRYEDTHLYSASGADVTVDFGETLQDVVSCIHVDNSVGLANVANASIAVSGSSATFTLANALAANDVLHIKVILA